MLKWLPFHSEVGSLQHPQQLASCMMMMSRRRVYLRVCSPLQGLLSPGSSALLVSMEGF